MSVWAPPPGLLSLPQPDRAPGERPELLPHPSDPTRNWCHPGCIACNKIHVGKLVVASLCSADELEEEPYKSMGNIPRLFTHSLQCDVQYYKAYSKKPEERLQQAQAEQAFFAKFEKTREALLTLRQQVSALGGTLVEVAESVGSRPVRGEELRSMLFILRQDVLWVGEQLIEHAGTEP
ncbi:hypothetical protein K438DRAFT_1758515 [Mycena galopus ATCC 62051]|nr:hypothetical protein K438DRAFT_1758515 [Mycena galopus ATCC 62051]